MQSKHHCDDVQIGMPHYCHLHWKWTIRIHPFVLEFHRYSYKLVQSATGKSINNGQLSGYYSAITSFEKSI